MTSIVALALVASVVAGRAQAPAGAAAGQAPAGAARGGGGRGQSTFTGGTPSTVDSAAVRTSRLLFPKGSRSNWHTHASGQLLMIEKGKGLTQVRGGAVKEMLPGQPWWTAAGIEHWHGASPDEDALQLTIYEGAVNWLEPVTDAQYHTPPGR
jgi:quercetin dioxygenase-like cupin family protein